MRELSKNDWRVLAQLLEMASNEFSNHGCNDFELENTLDNKHFAACVEEALGYESVVVGKDGQSIVIMDWSAMDFFAHIARENSES